MNSIIQQLYTIDYFTESIFQLNLKKNDSFTYSLQEVFQKMKFSTSQSISSKKLLKTFKDLDGKPITINEQMDADEFLAKALEKLNEESQEMSLIIQNCFAGTQILEILSNCNHKYQRLEVFQSISLNVKNKRNLENSLEGVISGEALEGENAFYCENCQEKVSAVTRTSFKTLPNLLVFTLRRFEYDLESMTRVKIDDYFEFPFEINLKKYSDKFMFSDILHENSYFEYKLKGIVVHVGKADHGHYYSYIFQQGTWLEFNDSHVSLSDLDTVKARAFGGSEYSEEVVPSAYLLMYERAQRYSFQIPGKIIEPSVCVLEPSKKSEILAKNIEN